MKKWIFLLAVCGFAVVGCVGSAEPEVTKAEENAYRNPPKEMPAAAREGMMKGMEKAREANQGGG